MPRMQMLTRVPQPLTLPRPEIVPEEVKERVVCGRPLMSGQTVPSPVRVAVPFPMPPFYMSILGQSRLGEGLHPVILAVPVNVPVPSMTPQPMTKGA
jgi:hypothetical protein